mgnify:CR=1 FL=1
MWVQVPSRVLAGFESQPCGFKSQSEVKGFNPRPRTQKGEQGDFRPRTRKADQGIPDLELEKWTGGSQTKN